MRTAVCISGLLRSWDIIKLNNLNNIIKDSDVFYVTDLELNIPNINNTTSAENQNFYSAEDIDFFQSRKAGETNIENCLNMFYKIYQCNNLKKQFEQKNNFKYDVCIRLRTDTHFDREILLEDIQENTLYISEDKGYGGICDQFSYGNSNVMDRYSDVFCNIRTYVAEGCTFHPETLLKYHSDKQEFLYKYIGNNFFNIIRT